MRQKDQASLAPLRMLKAALMNKEVEKGRALDEAESLQVVNALVKQRRDSVEQFTAGGRQELADKEQAEIVFLEKFLPPAADPAAIAAAIDAAVAETGAAGPEGHGQGHEGRHGAAGRACPWTAGGQRGGQETARRLTAQTFRGGAPSKSSERHREMPLIHPPGRGLNTGVEAPSFFGYSVSLPVDAPRLPDLVPSFVTNRRPRRRGWPAADERTPRHDRPA